MRRGDDPAFRPLWLHKIENLNPSCPSCNISKSVFSLETWREEIEKKVGRMNNTSANYRILKRMRLIKETGVPVVFYFEKLNDVKNNL